MKKMISVWIAASMLIGILGGCDSSTSDQTVKNFTEPQEGEEIVCISVEGYGDIKIKLFSDLLPEACENFLGLVEEGYYDELIFHRVISNFMIQGGDPKGNGTGGESYWGGKFDGGISENLVHVRGAVAYANSGTYTEEGSQFYIVTAGAVDADLLDRYEEDGYGPFTEEQKELYTTIGGAPWLDGSYTVFGQVIEGLDIAIEIADETETDSNDKPKKSIKMEKVTVEKYDGTPVEWYASENIDSEEASEN